MRGFRTALLVAGAALAGVPAAAWAQAAPGQDQGRPEHQHGDHARADHGDGDHHRDEGDRHDEHRNASATPAAQAPRPEGGHHDEHRDAPATPAPQPQRGRPDGTPPGIGAVQARPDEGRHDHGRDAGPRGSDRNRDGFDPNRHVPPGEPNRFGDDRRPGGNGRGDRDWEGRGWDGHRYDRPGDDGHDRGGAGWRGDSRYDWRGYRDGHRELFRSPRYYPPRAYGYGYGYRPFARGYRLQPFFYGREYWIADPYRYRLSPVYGPYRWIRYYDDVLLVDVRSGVVVDVIRDFFWR